MCGIAGHFSAKPLPEDTPEILGRQLETIVHRGPDGLGRHVDRARGVALGHTRLAINDLEGGRQPLHAIDGRYVLTTNGEFYDFKRHRSTLMAEGDRFLTKSDSEIAIGLYRKFGLDFTRHLRGEFAFALYDREADELILLRDRFGVRPLFYWVSPDRDILVYGSEAKSVIAHPAVPARLDPRAALHQLMQTIAPGMSAFEGVVSLDPGHFLRIRKRDGRLEIHQQRYWDFDFPLEADRPVDFDETEHVERVRDELIRAIVLRLEADVPVAPWEALAGADVQLRTARGNAVARIPPGAKAGSKLRLRGQGFADGQGGHGDMLVVVRYALPDGLTDQQRDLLHKAAAAGPSRVSGGARTES